MDKYQLRQIRKALRQRGCCLVTGPSGSGKMSTVYSLLDNLNRTSDKVCTIEHHISRELAGISQFQIDSTHGLDYIAYLAKLRQQFPDVIAIDALSYDKAVAEAAMETAMDHLVLSTFNAADCVSSIKALLNIGVNPLTVAMSLNIVIAQRIIRQLCDCKEKADKILTDDVAFEQLGMTDEEFAKIQLFQGKGCKTCIGTGFRGRLAVFEVLPVSDELRGLIARNASCAELRGQAEKEGMMSLKQKAMQALVEGKTTIRELVRCRLI